MHEALRVCLEKMGEPLRSKEVVSQVIQRDQPLSPTSLEVTIRLAFDFGSRFHSPSQKGHVRRIARRVTCLYTYHNESVPSLFQKSWKKLGQDEYPPTSGKTYATTKFGLSIKYPPDIINQLHHPFCSRLVEP